MSHQNYLYLEYRRALGKFRKLQTRFERRIANNTFRELTLRRRHKLLAQLRKLRQKIEQLTSRLKLATAGGSLALGLGFMMGAQTDGLAAPGPPNIGVPKTLATDKTLLNSETDGNQENPDAAMNDSGQSVFVWESADNQIMGKGFGPDAEGLEFTVTDDTLWNTDPTVSLNNEGDFVVAWNSMETTSPYSTFAIKYMRFEIDGEDIVATGPFTIAEGTNTVNETVGSPDVALDDNGNFAIVWETYDIAPSHNIRARFVNSEDISAEELEVTSHSDEDESADSPSVDIDNDGNFIIVWHGSYYEYVNSSEQNNYSTIYSERYHENEAQGSQEVIEHIGNRNRHRSPDVALSGDGSYAVSWHDEYNNYNQEYIYVKRFDAGGGDLGQITVDDQSFADLSDPAIAADKDGGFVIAYDVDSNGGYGEILGKRYNQLGNHVEDLDFQDSGGEESVSNPTIAMNSRGDFVVAWDDEEYADATCEENQDCEGSGVYFKRYTDPDNEPYCIVDQHQVNEYTTGNQRNPSMSTDAAGNYVVVWEGEWNAASEQSDGIIGQRYDKDGNKQGSEFQINTTTEGNQQHPDVALDSNGDFIVVWRSYDSGGQMGFDLHAQMFSADGSKNGTEFEIDQTDPVYGGPSEPAVDINDNGDAIVVWQDAGVGLQNIYARLVTGPNTFAANEFQVDASTVVGNRSYPDVAMANDGSFVVTWGSFDAGGNHQTYVRRFDETATALDANDVQLSSSGMGNTHRQSIALDRGSGDFMISWSEYYVGNATIYMSKFESDGDSVFEEKMLTNLADAGSTPGLATNDLGEFAIVWEEPDDGNLIRTALQGSDNELIYDGFLPFDNTTGYNPVVGLNQGGDLTVATNLNASGPEIFAKTIAKPLVGNIDAGSEFIVNSKTTKNQTKPDIAQNTDGDFVVVWVDSYAATIAEHYIKAQRYNSAGIRQGDEMTVNNETGNSVDNPAVAITDDGDFMVVWSAYSFAGGEGDDILGSVLDWDGTVIKDDFIVNIETSSNQRFPEIAINPDGDFQVIWSDRSNYSENSIMGQLFSSDGTPNVAGNEVLAGITETYEHIEPSIAFNNDGDMAIPYIYDYNEVLNGFFLLDASKTLIVDNLAFSASTEVDAHRPTVAANDDGDFILTWSEYESGPNIYHLMVRQYTSGNAFEGDPISVKELESEVSPHIVLVDDGDFVISYTEYEVEDDLYNAYVRRISGDLDPIGPEIQVNEISASGSVNNSIASSPDGSYTVVWQSSYADGSDEAIMARQFVSHKPIVSNQGLTLDEGAEGEINAEHLSFDNPYEGDESALLTVNQLPTEGTLKLDGNNVALFQELDDDDMFFLSYEHDGDETTRDFFTFSVANEDFGTNEYTFEITVNPVNDPPTVANAIDDQFTDGFEAFNFTVPANTFTDVEETPLTLSATQADGSALPAWLSFTAGTGVFSGTAPNDPNFDTTVDVRVTASDGEDEVSDDFTITIRTVLAIGNEGSDQMLFYPNPTDGILHLRMSGDLTGSSTIYLFNTSGQLMDQSRIEHIRQSMIVDIDLANLRQGLYLLKLVNDNTTSTFMISKE